MIRVWSGPAGVGIEDGMCKPGNWDWCAIVRLSGGKWERIEVADPDAEVSLDGKWTRLGAVDGYRAQQMRRVCPECRQEVRE